MNRFNSLVDAAQHDRPVETDDGPKSWLLVDGVWRLAANEEFVS